jgi:soluble lytic murein transglycosylase-like protein
MMMERFGLILLVAAAAIGLSIDDGATPTMEPNAPIGDETAAVEEPRPPEETPVRSDVGADALATADDAMLQQILERFAVRHTAMSLRERERVARVIIEEARAHDLSPDLVMGVIEVESAGYHLAESHVGALGLMQLLPGTGQEVALKRGIPWKGPHTLFDPVVNVRLGTSYLRELADRYDGNVDIALAAYNWGPGRIDRFLRRGAGLPSRYVKQVRRAVDRYAAIPSARS